MSVKIDGRSSLVKESAYLIVTKFEPLYRQFAADPRFRRIANRPFTQTYALPVFGTNSDSVSVRYEGLDRNPLHAYDRQPALAAEIRMAELEKLGRCAHSFLFNSVDLADVLCWVDLEKPGQYEPVWTRLAGSSESPPSSFSSIGFEPNYFPDGFFSPSCDCMCFPRWHGTKGSIFSQFFNLLNRHGLFDDVEVAKRFLDHYLSFEWTERPPPGGAYSIVEVFKNIPVRLRLVEGNPV